MLCRARSVLYSVEFRVWVWKGPFQDQVSSDIIPRIVLQEPCQKAGISRVSRRCSIFAGVFCKFNPPIFCCLGSFSKDDSSDLAERPMNKIRTFQTSSALLASLVAPLNRLNENGRGGGSQFGLVRTGLSLFVLSGTFLMCTKVWGYFSRSDPKLA